MLHNSDHPLVGVIMGGESDWPTMQAAVDILNKLEVRCEVKVVSAHRTPDRMSEYAKTAEERGVRVIIAGAGGAAHLPGMVAAHATTVPVLGVPVASKSSNVGDMAALLSIAQMPGGVPVATFAVGEAGAKNAALHAASILAGSDPRLRERLRSWRQKLTESVPSEPKD